MCCDGAAAAAARGEVDGAAFSLFGHYEQALRERLTTVAERLQENHARLTAKRAELGQERREERKLERLAERHRTGVETEAALAAERLLDELVLAAMGASRGRIDVAGEDRSARSDAPEVTPSTGWQRIRWGIAVVLVAKVGATALLPWQTDGVGSTRTALAADPAGPALAVVKPPGATEAVAAGHDGRTAGVAAGGDVKSMLEALARRQRELDQREKTLAEREDKLALYEKDVTEKIVQLEQVGKTLKEDLKRTSSATDEAAASLAKVYGAMKPSEAAPILDQLDEATALRILTRMKEKQVGEILPLMTRDRAIGLTRSLAGRVMPAAGPPKS